MTTPTITKKKILITLFIIIVVGAGAYWLASNSSNISNNPLEAVTGNSNSDNEPTEDDYYTSLPRPDSATLYFESDSTTTLDDLSKDLTVPFIDYLKGHPERIAIVVGHAAGVGLPEEEQSLSLQRAEAVAQHIVDQGVDPDQVQVEARGSTEPVGDNATDRGRSQNRRAVVSIN